MTIARIIPGPMGEGDLAHRTLGTRVVLADGSELQSVTKIVLTAVPGELWHAEIHCRVLVDEVAAEAQIRGGRGQRPPFPNTPPLEPRPCSCTTYCMHGKVTQTPCRPGTYCRERATPLPPDPPKRPPERMVTMGRAFPQCPSCGSTMMRKRCFFFGKRPGCIQPECTNYGGHHPSPFDLGPG